MAIDGGKDSLSMAATAHGEVVKGPGSLVISAYCDMPDITKKVTPDFKLGDGGRIIMVDIAQGKRRTGGSALAQASLPSELAQMIRFALSGRDDSAIRLCNHSQL
jgi:phosphoribosylformylglycinamidine synthase